ncbi:hypothetical protein [Actinomadura vinacea]
MQGVVEPDCYCIDVPPRSPRPRRPGQGRPRTAGGTRRSRTRR